MNKGLRNENVNINVLTDVVVYMEIIILCELFCSVLMEMCRKCMAQK